MLSLEENLEVKRRLKGINVERKQIINNKSYQFAHGHLQFMLFCYVWKAKKKKTVSLSKIHHDSQAQNNIFEELEKYLVQWIHRHNPHRNPWRTVLLQQRSWTSLKICGRWKTERIRWRHWVSNHVENDSRNLRAM